MNRSLLRLALLGAAMMLLAACSSPNGSADPYADPGTTPPPPITDPTIATSGSISESSKGPGLFDINVAGFAAPEAAGLRSAAIDVTNLPPSAFTVVEDGVVKGITVERIGTGTTRAAADVVFVFDTTYSMGPALNAVQSSIIEFVEYLDEGGLDVQVGAVTFGDAYDTQVAGNERGTSLRGDVPPSFDRDERPSFDLSTDFEAFRIFIEGDSQRGGGDFPENGIGAISFAYEELAWRPGAQKMMIFITDACQHTDETFESEFGISAGNEQWTPPATETILSTLQGNAVVHVIAPAEPLFCDGGFVNMKDFTGVEGTGGTFVDWNYEPFDLTDLPLAAASRGGYVITYRGTTSGGDPKEVRVVIDDGGSVRGEFTLEGRY